MKEKILFSVAGALAIVTIWLLFSFSKTGGNVVVVDSQRVLEEYQGFLEAKDSYEAKVNDLSKSFNEKRGVFESKTKEYEILESTLSNAERSKKRADLAVMQQELMKLGTAIEGQTTEEESKLLEGVYNKINDFVQRYGKKKGYAAILGANGQGNVMYVDGQIDITQEVINALNKEYVEGVQ
ncbi:OmpH family outer membrane protein [Flagellimonas pacifica]|uniref:Periplasmic chaperone for outer membrane proteins Skp n=1 Tax=Flagellimonas pacifica TaxID=1247520 RepID=A0A285MWV4_9FLAO|nr:OmpH family outer membrane protein [Allomuricauda parva]SNZ01680.1 periplasmic chaperone for outer membrane proteins Skp [Allomuricauda parva]